MSTKESVQRLYQGIRNSLLIVNGLEKSIIKELAISEFPTDTPNDLALMILELVAVLRTHLTWEYHNSAVDLINKESDDFNEDLNRLEQRILAANNIANTLVPLLEFIVGAKSRNNPWQIIGQMERLSKSLGLGAKVIVRPRWEYNYSYVSITGYLKVAATNASEKDRSLRQALLYCLTDKPYFFALSFPPISSENSLHMAIWAHEIGHLIDNLEGEARTGNPVDYLSIELVKNMEVSVPYEYIETLLVDQDFNDTDMDEIISSEVSLPVASMVQKWAQELFADIFSIRLFGPAALFSFVEFTHPISQTLDLLSDEKHPSLRIRLVVLLKELDIWTKEYPEWMSDFPEDIVKAYKAEIKHLRGLINSPLDTNYSGDIKLLDIFYSILYKQVDDVSNKLREVIDELMSGRTSLFLTAKDLAQIVPLIQDLRDELPPDLAKSQLSSPAYTLDKSLALIFNVGWLTWHSDQTLSGQPDVDNYDRSLHHKTCIDSLLLKANEIVGARQRFRSKPFEKDNLTDVVSTSDIATSNSKPVRSGASVISREEIEARRKSGQLRIIPVLDPSSQLSRGSLDIRLGNEFIQPRLSAVTAVDPAEMAVGAGPERFQSKIFLPFGKPYVLHPRQFVLGSTMEYLSLPNDLLGLVLGRSSWGRIGLVIVTANKVDPGFKGCITLELSNLGNVPILLYPGMRIGQLIFHTI